MKSNADVSEVVFSIVYFEKHTFEYMAYGRFDCYKGPDGSFYLLEEVPGLNAYVIESAENEYEASHGVFEDAGLFDIGLSYEELVQDVIKWLNQYAIQKC